LVGSLVSPPHLIARGGGSSSPDEVVSLRRGRRYFTRSAMTLRATTPPGLWPQRAHHDCSPRLLSNAGSQNTRRCVVSTQTQDFRPSCDLACSTAYDLVYIHSPAIDDCAGRSSPFSLKSTLESILPSLFAYVLQLPPPRSARFHSFQRLLTSLSHALARSFSLSAGK
jgi:hypothetical protein